MGREAGDPPGGGTHLSLSLTEGCGYAAAACTTLSFVPQVLKIWQTRSAADISSGMYGLFIVGLALWLAYGVILKSWPIICANTVTIALAAAVLLMKWHFERRPRP